MILGGGKEDEREGKIKCKEGKDQGEVDERTEEMEIRILS